MRKLSCVGVKCGRTGMLETVRTEARGPGGSVSRKTFPQRIDGITYGGAGMGQDRVNRRDREICTEPRRRDGPDPRPHSRETSSHLRSHAVRARSTRRRTRHSTFAARAAPTSTPTVSRHFVGTPSTWRSTAMLLSSMLLVGADRAGCASCGKSLYRNTLSNRRWRFPSLGSTTQPSYQGYQTRLFKDAAGNTLQVYLDRREGRVVHILADAENASIAFSARAADGAPASLEWGEAGRPGRPRRARHAPWNTPSPPRLLGLPRLVPPRFDAGRARLPVREAAISARSPASRSPSPNWCDWLDAIDSLPASMRARHLATLGAHERRRAPRSAASDDLDRAARHAVDRAHRPALARRARLADAQLQRRLPPGAGIRSPATRSSCAPRAAPRFASRCASPPPAAPSPRSPAARSSPTNSSPSSTRRALPAPPTARRVPGRGGWSDRCAGSSSSRRARS